MSALSLLVYTLGRRVHQSTVSASNVCSARHIISTSISIQDIENKIKQGDEGFKQLMGAEKVERTKLEKLRNEKVGLSSEIVLRD